MLGRRESRPAPVFAAAAALVAAALPAVAGAGPGAQKSGRVAAAKPSRLLSLYALETRLAAARAELSAIRARAGAVERERAEVAHEFRVAQSVLHESQSQLAARLRTLYEEGEPDALAVLLGATSLEDAVTRLDELERSARLNRDAIRQSERSQRLLAQLRARLAARAAELAQLETKAEHTAASLEAARAARIRYLAALRRQRLRAAQVARLDAAAQRGADRSQALAAVPASAAAAPKPASTTSADGVRSLTVTATGYSLPGATATGLPVGYGVVAVDPSVIPLGTRMTIPGYGEGVAADTGSAVVGATIDLWFPTQAEALAWGRRVVTITLH